MAAELRVPWKGAADGEAGAVRRERPWVLLVPSRARIIAGTGIALLGIALLVILPAPLRTDLGRGDVGLVFLVPAVLGAAVGGAPAAGVGVVAGFAAYNFFFVQPLLTFKVNRAEDVLGLGIYVVVGTVIAMVVGREQNAALVSHRREVEARTLARLSRSLVGSQGLGAIASLVAREVRALLGLETVAVLLEGDTGLTVAGLQGSLTDEQAESLRLRFSSANPQPLRLDIATLALPLCTRDRSFGLLVLCGNLDEIDPHVTAAVVGQVALAVDRAQLDEASRRLQVLEEVERLRSSLVGAVSHDLRTPLASIAAAVSDLRDPSVTFSPQDRDTLLATIEDEAHRLDRLVANLLDFGRVEAGALQLKTEAVEVDDLVGEALDGLRGLLGSRRVELDIPSDLPPVEVDPALIVQVLVNLLENAHRHGPSGTPLAVSARQHDRWAAVRVSDRGPGVAREERQRIFDMYYRAQRTRGGGGGGLGLAICRGYIQAHGGEIRVEATPGGGATFVFRVPLAAPTPALPGLPR